MDQRSQNSEAPRPEKPTLSAEQKADRLALIMYAAYEIRRRRQEMLAAKRSMVGR